MLLLGKGGLSLLLLQLLLLLLGIRLVGSVLVLMMVSLVRSLGLAPKLVA